MSLRAAVTSARKRLNENYYLGIFPEGGYSDEGIKKVEKGVFYFAEELGVQIVPVSMRGMKEIWPKNQESPARTGKIVINIGSPLEINGSKETLCKKLQEEIQKLYEQYPSGN
jgi:1-acyl-sn-glycerol-3-phosphate acyltransferase